MRWSEPSLPHDGGPPTIKNHSVTHHGGLLYCFGGYDGRRNHMTLLVYSIKYQRWIRPTSAAAAASSSSAASVATSLISGGSSAIGSMAGTVRGAGGGLVGDDISSGGSQQRQPRSSNGTTTNGLVAVGGGDSIASHSINNHSNANTAAANDLGGGGSDALNIIVSGTPPPGRNGHTATLAYRHSDDEDDDDGRIIIIGGWLGSGPLAAQDMHVLDVSNGVENLRWYEPTVKGTPPGPCNMHSADFVPSLREVYVFRGGNGREYLNDLHALNVDTYTWRKVQTTGQTPQQRANHSSAVLEETNELFIFGGWNGKERLNDIHILDTMTSTWTCPHVGGVLPHPRAGMTLTALRGKLFLFGGSGTSSKCFQDLQILDRKEMAWLDVMQSEETSSSSNFYQNEHQSEKEEYHSASYHSRHAERQVGAVGGARLTGGGGSAAMIRHESMDDPSTSSTLGNIGCRYHMDWRTRALDRHRSHQASVAAAAASPNPNDEDTRPTIFIHGRGPGRRAGHTATAVNRHMYVFGGSCGSDYLNDFFVLDTDPPPQVSVTEPTSLQLLHRRLRHFYNDEEFSDVTFLVEGRRVFGHRLVLSLVSDCFRAMFTTGFRESEAGAEIEIPNCSYDAFVAMMEYIYTGQAPQTDIRNEGEGGINRVVDLLELADQFFLDHLKQACERILQPAVSASTVEYLLQVAQKTNAMQLEAVCAHFERNRDT